jgi:hypothetical protein
MAVYSSILFGATCQAFTVRKLGCGICHLGTMIILVAWAYLLQHELCIVLRFTEHIDFGSKIFCL